MASGDATRGCREEHGLQLPKQFDDGTIMESVMTA